MENKKWRNIGHIIIDEFRLFSKGLNDNPRLYKYVAWSYMDVVGLVDFIARCRSCS